MNQDAKLTMISVRFNGRLYTVFAPCQQTAEGQTQTSQQVLDDLLNRLGVRRGDTYSLG